MKRIALLLLLMIVPVSVFAQGPVPAGALRIMTYNVGSFSKYMDDSIDMVASILLEAGADAVGINEVDNCTARHKENQTELLAGSLGGWNWHFGNTLNSSSGKGYGNSVLVKEDILRSYTVPLGFYIGCENRCVAVVETGRYVIGAVHLDHKSRSVRECQVSRIAKWVSEEYADCDKPVLLCGDFNDIPSSSVISMMKQDWEQLSTVGNSFPSSVPDRCIDYIFRYKSSAPVEVVSSGVMAEFENGDVTLASDHLPVFADIIAPSFSSQSR